MCYQHHAKDEALRYLVWRVAFILGILICMSAMVSKVVLENRAFNSLLIPVRGVALEELKDSFSQPRDEGRRHDAIDISASRGTPVVAADGGRVVAMVSSASGGLSVYEIDRAQERCFYYAHLDGYAKGLQEGMYLKRGAAIGYVGSTGNAPDDVPHLHFAVYRLTSSHRCSEGVPVNPMDLF